MEADRVRLSPIGGGGCTGELADARFQAEGALADYAAAWRERQNGVGYRLEGDNDPARDVGQTLRPDFAHPFREVPGAEVIDGIRGLFPHVHRRILFLEIPR